MRAPKQRVPVLHGFLAKLASLYWPHISPSTIGRPPGPGQATGMHLAQRPATRSSSSDVSSRARTRLNTRFDMAFTPVIKILRPYRLGTYQETWLKNSLSQESILIVGSQNSGCQLKAEQNLLAPFHFGHWEVLINAPRKPLLRSSFASNSDNATLVQCERPSRAFGYLSLQPHTGTLLGFRPASRSHPRIHRFKNQEVG